MVPHHRLLTKLQYYGIRDEPLLWIEAFLKDRRQQVLVNGQSSSQSHVSSGISQGSVIGPLLFLILINYLPDSISSTACLFANDCLPYRTICFPEDSLALQSDLDSLQRWEAGWLMKFNPERYEVIRVTNKRKIIDAQYTIHGTKV